METKFGSSAACLAGRRELLDIERELGRVAELRTGLTTAFRSACLAALCAWQGRRVQQLNAFILAVVLRRSKLCVYRTWRNMQLGEAAPRNWKLFPFDKTLRHGDGDAPQLCGVARNCGALQEP